MPKHDPARKRKGFWRKARKVKITSSPPDRPESIPTTYNYEFESNNSVELDTPAEQLHPKLLGTMEELAPLVWETDYTLLFKLEQVALEANYGLMTGAHLLKSLAGISSYAKRKDKQRRTETEIAERANEQAMTAAVAVMRQANQWRHSFSSLVRSLSALASRMPTKEWNRQVRLKQLVSYPTSIKFLKMAMQVHAHARAAHEPVRHSIHHITYHMIHVASHRGSQCRPKPNFLTTSAIQHWIFDQKYAKKGESRAKHRGVERVDASGDLVELVSTVLCNFMKTEVPQTLGR